MDRKDFFPFKRTTGTDELSLIPSPWTRKATPFAGDDNAIVRVKKTNERKLKVFTRTINTVAMPSCASCVSALYKVLETRCNQKKDEPKKKG